jgi:hypothetical protein
LTEDSVPRKTSTQVFAKLYELRQEIFEVKGNTKSRVSPAILGMI